VLVVGCWLQNTPTFDGFWGERVGCSGVDQTWRQLKDQHMWDQVTASMMVGRVTAFPTKWTLDTTPLVLARVRGFTGEVPEVTVDGLQRSLATSAALAKDLQTEVEAIRDRRSEMAKAMAEVVADRDQRVKEVEVAMADMGVDAQAMREAVAQSGVVLSQAEADNRALRDRVRELETQVQSLHLALNQCTHMSNSVQTMERAMLAALSTKGQQLDTLEARLTTLRQAVCRRPTVKAPTPQALNKVMTKAVRTVFTPVMKKLDAMHMRLDGAQARVKTVGVRLAAHKIAIARQLAEDLEVSCGKFGTCEVAAICIHVYVWLAVYAFMPSCLHAFMPSCP
jgi:hypothetical protein